MSHSAILKSLNQPLPTRPIFSGYSVLQGFMTYLELLPFGMQRQPPVVVRCPSQRQISHLISNKAIPKSRGSHNELVCSKYNRTQYGSRSEIITTRINLSFFPNPIYTQSDVFECDDTLERGSGNIKVRCCQSVKIIWLNNLTQVCVKLPK